MNWQYENGRIYSISEDNELLAETTYEMKENGLVDINHTYVAPELRGKGAASEMMEVVAKYFRKHSHKVTASCSYANSWLKKHREEYADIISGELDSETTACRIDGRH